MKVRADHIIPVVSKNEIERITISSIVLWNRLLT
jgi:hypothetical protein